MGNVIAQNQLRVQEVLNRKNFAKLKRYIRKESRFNRSLIYERNKSNRLQDLTRENREGVFYFAKSYPDSSDFGKKKNYLFRIKVLTCKNEIIYYELSKGIPVKTEGRSENFEIISTYKNEVAYDELIRAFNLIYKVDLNERELFNQDITYGEACGRGGIDPAEKTKMDEFIEANDKESLIKWLQSTNTEKQIYALRGLYYLNKKGIQLSKEEMQMIDFVKSKKGMVNVCFACNFYRRSIEQVTKEYNFQMQSSK